MKKAAIVFLLTATSLFAAEVIKRGAPINKETKSAALAEVLANPDAYAKAPVIVEGVVTANCEMKGCWMQLAPEGSSAGVHVTFKDYGFFVPTDAKGLHARAEGVASVKTLSKKEADHLEEDGLKLTRNPDGTAKQVAFVASGVELWR